MEVSMENKNFIFLAAVICIIWIAYTCGYLSAIFLLAFYIWILRRD
jgi:hypothetical protein